MQIKKDPTGQIEGAELTEEYLSVCPFCGCPEAYLDHNGRAAYAVVCGGCGAQAPGEVGRNDQEETAHLAAASSAVVAWNARSHQSA